MLARKLIVLLLCCLLPVQGALTFASSAGMMSHHARLLQTAPVTRLTDPAPVVTVHDAHGQQQEHHRHHAHHAQSKQHTQHAQPAALPSAGNAVKFLQSSAKPTGHSKASCDDCAKCCLVGAAAPPPAAMQAPAVSFVLHTFKPVYPEVAGHIPEKPERPPRQPAHSLT